MRLSTLPIMKGMNGGGIVMRRLATDSPARSAQEPPMSEGMTRLLPLVELSGSFNFIETEKRRTRSMRVRLFGRALAGQDRGVDSVHTLGLGLGRTGAGPGRIGEVFGGVADIQGLEPGSSPTSGTCFPCSEACGPLSVYKSPLWTPAGAHFWW